NVSEVRSDAFLMESQRIRSLRLPQLNHNDLDAYSKRFLYAVQPMNIKSHSTATSELDEVLKWLWNVAVGPILDELGFKEPHMGDKWPRVWWVGSGLLSILPIHAAGHHREGSARTAIDRVISSYAYTIKSLAYARERLGRAIHLSRQTMLVVGMPTTPGQNDISFVKAEIDELQTLIPSCTILQNPKKTEVLSMIPNHQITHFSCHGYSSVADPSQ